MPAVARLGDNGSGHGCYPPRGNNQASDNVYVNGIGVHRQGDSYPSHCCGPSCHGASLGSGSSSVYINGKQCGRIGDPIDCGSTVAAGSGNVFAGG